MGQSFWSPVSYGWAPVYVLQIAGVPTLFLERDVGMIPPDWTPGQSYAVDTSLVIDDSSEIGVDAIDRERGIGVGMDLTFKLLDTANVRDLMRAPEHWATLTTDLEPTDTEIFANTPTGWPASGLVYIGNECITYASATSTKFNIDNRAMMGTLLGATYRKGTTGQILTDRPRFLRGRDVTLWAVMVDPSGAAPDEGLLAGPSSKVIWRGRINSAPDRQTDGFTLTAQSLERIVDTPLPGKVTGKVAAQNDLVQVNNKLVIAATLLGWDFGTTTMLWKHVIPVQPFKGLSVLALSYGQALSYLKDAWDAAVVSYGASADIGQMLINGPTAQGDFEVYVEIVDNPALYSVAGTLTSFAQPSGKAFFGEHYGTSIQVPFAKSGAPLIFNKAGSANGALKINITNGDPADLPTSGQLVLRNGNFSCSYKYDNLTIAADAVQVWITALPGQVKLTPAQITGSTAEFVGLIENTWSTILLAQLESSGMTGERGALDILPRGQGYGIPESLIDVLTIGYRLGTASTSLVGASANTAGKSVPDVMGGVLGLLRLALVMRPDPDDELKLTVVETGVGSDYLWLLTDDDLLSHNDDPVVSVRKADAPNAITVELQPPNDAQEPSRVIAYDQTSIEAEGKREATFVIPTYAVDQLMTLAPQLAASHFAQDMTGQAVELRVHPAVQAQVGDVIYLNTTHPAIWTWGSIPGGPGYSGLGRVVGRRMNLKTTAVTLTVLIDGQLQFHALSPSAPVTGYDVAVHPAYVELSSIYYQHFSMCAAVAPFRVGFYRPGDLTEIPSAVIVNSVTTEGSGCRIYLATNTETIYSDTYLTIPATDRSTYQSLFAHVDDGTYWS